MIDWYIHLSKEGDTSVWYSLDSLFLHISLINVVSVCLLRFSDFYKFYITFNAMNFVLSSHRITCSFLAVYFCQKSQKIRTQPCPVTLSHWRSIGSDQCISVELFLCWQILVGTSGILLILAKQNFNMWYMIFWFILTMRFVSFMCLFLDTKVKYCYCSNLRIKKLLFFVKCYSFFFNSTIWFIVLYFHVQLEDMEFF